MAPRDGIRREATQRSSSFRSFTEEENSAEDQAVARGVQYRVVVERGMLETQAVTVEEALQATEAGEDVRFAKRVPLKLMIIDRQLALMPLTSSGDVVGALLVRESALLDALMALFEIVWEQATPLLLGTSGRRCGPCSAGCGH